MTTIVEINHNNPQAGPLVEYLASLPFATIRKAPQKSFDEAVKECNGVDSREFFAEVRRRINRQYDKLENA